MTSDFYKEDKCAERAVTQYLHKNGLTPRSHSDKVAIHGHDMVQCKTGVLR